jgi:3-oxoacyl-[acyl-carrier protein] reductase
MSKARLLLGKTAIVTGAGAGIGESIALYFAEHGAKVTVLDKDEESTRRVASAVEGIGGEALPVHADVRSVDALSRAVEQTLHRFGQIDILINNAGMYPRQLFLEMTEQQWDEMQDVNLKGVFQMTRLVAPHMVSRKQGRIVNISSVTFHLGTARLTYYVAAKGGVIGLTRSVARELGPDGIYVNCITPGAIKTESEARVATEEEVNAIVKLQSLQRRIMPLDIAKVCVFLSCPLSDGMTGQTLNVDGGWVMH